MSLAENLKRIRKSRGLTQEELADVSGLSRASIQVYEQGKYEPKLDALQRLSAALRCNISALTGVHGFRDTVTPGVIDVTGISAAGVELLQKMADEIAIYEQKTQASRRVTLQAAHSRQDATPEQEKNDDDLMDNDSNW